MSTLLGDILPLGSLWERHGQPRQRCARKEDESPKVRNPRRGKRVNKKKKRLGKLLSLGVLDETEHKNMWAEALSQAAKMSDSSDSEDGEE